MAPANILVVEDDTHISQLITYNLNKAGFDCTPTRTGEEALDVLSRKKLDLVLLDIMLPKMDGWEVCKLLRKDEKLKSLPVIMVTARGEESDRVSGLEMGANDYMVKPFSMRELILRVKALLNKQGSLEQEPEKLKAGDILIDIPRYKVMVGERPVALTNMEFKLLVLLMRRQGRVQARDTLLEHVWDFHSEVLTRTVDTHIKRLRHKLKKAGRHIETVRGVGYKFSEDRK